MNIDELKPAWDRLEQRLTWQEQSVSALVADRTNREARSNLQPVVYAQLVQIVIGIGLAGLGARFWIPRLDAPLLLACGLITHAYGVALIVNGIRVWLKVHAVDFGAPVTVVQRGIAQIESSLVTSGWILGLPWWLLWIPISVVVLTLGGIDILQQAPLDWLLWSSLLGLVGMAGTVLGYRYLRNKAEPAVNSRLDRLVAGASIQAAKARLAQIERFEA